MVKTCAGLDMCVGPRQPTCIITAVTTGNFWAHSPWWHQADGGVQVFNIAHMYFLKERELNHTYISEYTLVSLTKNFHGYITIYTVMSTLKQPYVIRQM